MSLDPGRVAVLRAAYDEALRTARNLRSSVRRLSGTLLPVASGSLERLGEDDRDRLDAFRVRFIELQDLLGAKIFRALLIVEQEKPGSQLDVLNRMEKRGVITSVQAWSALRDLRNSLSHDSPASDAERGAALNEALVQTSALLGVLDTVRGYCAANLGLDLPEP